MRFSEKQTSGSGSGSERAIGGELPAYPLAGRYAARLINNPSAAIAYAEYTYAVSRVILRALALPARR